MLYRRQFLKSMLVSGAMSLLAQAPAKRAVQDQTGDVKLAHRLNALSVTDDDLLFLQQIGLKWVRLEFPEAELGFDDLRRTQERYARFGIRVYSVVHPSYRSIRVQLGQPGRDQDIEIYCRLLRNLGRLDIPVASYDFHPANTYTTNYVQRRGYTAREFDLSDFRTRIEKQAFAREYSAEDIWSSYTYFMKAVLPVAAESGVKLALHPDDPPLARMNAVAKIFTDYNGYHRAEQIAGQSPYWGVTFCVGTWSEGGDRMGKNVFEMIRDFGGRGKIFEVHFRNVSGPLPHFVETFPDDGYMNMYEVMKALRQVNFNGAAEPDHVPKLAGDTGLMRAGTAYCIAYMRALLQRINEETG